MIIDKPKFIDSPFFIMDLFNWHLTKDASAADKQELREFKEKINKQKALSGA